MVTPAMVTWRSSRGTEVLRRAVVAQGLLDEASQSAGYVRRGSLQGRYLSSTATQLAEAAVRRGGRTAPGGPARPLRPSIAPFSRAGICEITSVSAGAPGDLSRRRRMTGDAPLAAGNAASPIPSSHGRATSASGAPARTGRPRRRAHHPHDTPNTSVERDVRGQYAPARGTGAAAWRTPRRLHGEDPRAANDGAPRTETVWCWSCATRLSRRRRYGFRPCRCPAR
jgi:hypothetical protein